MECNCGKSFPMPKSYSTCTCGAKMLMMGCDNPQCENYHKKRNNEWMEKSKTARNEVLQLSYIGTDDWSRPVYKDQHDMLWKDIALGDCPTPHLHSVAGNEMDGEPDCPIKQEYTILVKYEKSKKRFQYMMLSRLQNDCKTHLSENCHPSCRIRKEDIGGIIREMKDLWHQFTESEKPEWITWEQILDFERLMNGSTTSETE